MTLVPDHVQLTLSARLEHTNYAGFELQPSVRLLWKLNERHSVWPAASRAARTPSRGDRTAKLLGLVDIGQGNVPGPFGQLPLLTLFIGNDQVGSEHVSTFEAGYRAQLRDGLGVDLATFHSDYADLRSVAVGNPTCPLGVSITQNPFCVVSARYLVLPLMFGNDSDARMFGLEATADWRRYDWLRIQPTYSYLGSPEAGASPLQSLDASAVSDGLSPNHQLSLRTGANVGRRIEVDSWLRYVDELESNGIQGYTTLDARVGWQMLPNLEVSLVGQNLFDARHSEFISELGDIPLIELQRSAYVQFRWGR